MAALKLTIPPQFDGLPIIASVSGGKDSTALMLALREADIPFRAVFADTGWEHVLTYEYLDLLRERIGPIDVVRAEHQMAAEILRYNTFSSPAAKWCTRKLKVKPLRAYHVAIGDDTVSAIGVRREESRERAQVAEVDDDREWGGWIWRPLAMWTISDVLAQHHRHGVPVNPIYKLGFSRVGCAPCIHANKGDMKLWADVWPERIEEIAALEAKTGYTFFPRVPIHEVVAWARTSRGGRQLPLLPEPPSGGCFRWGLCDPPADP